MLLLCCKRYIIIRDKKLLGNVLKLRYKLGKIDRPGFVNLDAFLLWFVLCVDLSLVQFEEAQIYLLEKRKFSSMVL